MAKAAIMGYGTVGSGVYEIIKTNADKLTKNAGGETIDIKYILDIRDFPDHPEPALFTKDFNDILNDGEVTVAAEVMGGLHPAYEFTKALLEEYVRTLSIEAAQAKLDEITRTNLSAGIDMSVPSPTEPPRAPQEAEDAADGIMLKIHASTRQLEQLCDFMTAIGVQYEVL